MSRLSKFTIAAIGTLAITGCASMNVSSHVQRGLDVSRYHTYDWGPADALPAGDPRLEQNPFFQDHLRGEVERAMTQRGFEWSAAGERADLLLHYHANISERLDVDRLDVQRGYCGENGCDVPTRQYEAGTLVIDVIDARTNRLIWRGWAQSAVKDMLANQDTMARQINEAIARMFEEFPKPL